MTLILTSSHVAASKDYLTILDAKNQHFISLIIWNFYSNWLIFIARRHTDARYWYSKSVRLSVCLSVCLSVRNVPVSNENGLTYRHSFFHHTVAQSFCFHEHQTSSRNSDGVTPCRGAKYRWHIIILRFSTNKSLYLANGAIYRHSYYGRWIGTRIRSIKWCHFQWPWINPTLFSRSHHSLTLNISQTATDTAIVTIGGE